MCYFQDRMTYYQIVIKAKTREKNVQLKEEESFLLLTCLSFFLTFV